MGEQVAGELRRRRGRSWRAARWPRAPRGRPRRRSRRPRPGSAPPRRRPSTASTSSVSTACPRRRRAGRASRARRGSCRPPTRAIAATAPSAISISLRVGDPADDLGDLLQRRALEVEALAAIDDRRHHLVRLGRGEDEDGVRRRLLERLQEGVPRLPGEHVRLVEDVDLPVARRGHVADPLAQVADVVDRAVRGGVHLDHVERGAGGDRDARLALPARASGSGPSTQFSERARIFAIEVLPVPREPTKR